MKLISEDGLRKFKQKWGEAEIGKLSAYISTSSTSKGPNVNLEDIYEDWVTIKTFVIAEVSVLLDEDNLGDIFKADPFEFFGYASLGS